MFDFALSSYCTFPLHNQDAVRQLVLEGTILDFGDILYLEPTWINDLLKAILDHDLVDARKNNFWKDELVKFCSGNSGIYFDLKKVHDNFSSTGVLTVGYLRFLWRNVPEIGDKAFFMSLVGTMTCHGVIFQGNPTETSSEGSESAMDDSAELFVPLHLPSNILENDLEEFATLLKHQFRKELVYEIHQRYVPPGFLGLLMARFLLYRGVKFLKCWNRGTAFTMGEVLVLLHLDTPLHGEDEARITVNLFGEQFIAPLNTTMDMVENEIKSVFVEHFGGIIFGLRQGYPRDINGINGMGRRHITSDSSSVDILSATDVVNAVVEQIEGLETHINRELSLLLRVLNQIDGNLRDVAKSCHMTLVRMKELRCEEVKCPRLVIIRPAATASSRGQKRSLQAMMKGLGRHAKSLVCRDMHLCFLCSHDFSEVLCGLNGNGYPFTVNRDWVTKIGPALQVEYHINHCRITLGSSMSSIYIIYL